MEKKYLKRYPIGNPRRLWKQDYYRLSTFSPGCVFFKEDDPNAVEKMRRAVKTCAEAGLGNHHAVGRCRPPLRGAGH